MNGRRAIVGLCMACALLVSAFAAQSASAISGTTSFTCKSTPGTGSFNKAHCKDADTQVNGGFSHEAIAQDTTTEVEITSKNTSSDTSAGSSSFFKSTIGGVGVTLTATEVHGNGSLENKLDVATGEHYSVSHATLTFTGVTSSLPGCKVSTHVSPTEMSETGVVHTFPLRITTTGQGDSVKIEPTTAGDPIARFYQTECTNVAFNGTFTVSGSLTCKPDGATINCKHEEVTTQNTLKLNGAAKAGQEGSVTVKARANSGQATTPISPTTVTT